MKMLLKKLFQIYIQKIGISNIEEFKEYLNNYNINLDIVKKKISIEIAWNDYILINSITQY